jgi:hypothetical protein
MWGNNNARLHIVVCGEKSDLKIYIKIQGSKKVTSNNVGWQKYY